VTTLAIDYIPPNRNEDGQIVGIDVAVRTLLDAYVRHGRYEKFYCRTRNRDDFEAFREQLKKIGGDLNRCTFLPTDGEGSTVETSILFRADPNINRLIATRSACGDDSYSICGLSHTMSSLAVMGTVATAITQPLQSWDAIICPSRAIRSVVESLWDAAGQGADLPPIQLPVIPLGIDTERFDDAVDDEKRAHQRQHIGATEEDTVILFYGRLSYHNKAHPLPLILAAEHVAKERQATGTTGDIHLVFFGYFTGESFRDDYIKLTASICHLVQAHFIENDDPRFPDAAWAGADVFVSLVDNVQESFGLTPIEAMACGLPAIVSDWDGYRDTVRDGTDGYLIPTLTPAPGAGVELIRRYLIGEDVYGEYLAGVSQSVAVDIDAMTEALRRLISNPDLRRKIGMAAKKRARKTFDWSVIIPAYDALWEELDQRRQVEAPSCPTVQNAITSPRELDPFSVFRSFPSHTFSPNGHLELSDSAIGQLALRLRHRMNMFLPVHLIGLEDLPKLLNILQRTHRVEDVLAQWPNASRVRLTLTLVWLVKMGVARYRPADNLLVS
jgi:glycosyltransferase involved in cell wall biosynthesis